MVSWEPLHIGQQVAFWPATRVNLKMFGLTGKMFQEIFQITWSSLCLILLAIEYIHLYQ
jgi:hypothetical protein